MNSKEIKKITVNASKNYDILIANGIFSDIGQIFKTKFKPCKIAIITDDTVDKLYAGDIKKDLENNGFSVCKFVFMHGEERKNIDTYSKILGFLATEQLTRSDLIIALGGGVVGDIAGFSASTFLRGIRFVQIPTTLLAQIDSSVGGKTAIDLKEGKNLVGAFYQPELVICDPLLLNTLPKDVFDDGLGEGIKYAILDEKIFSLIEKDFDLSQFIFLSIDYKRRIVEQDEFEKGNRKFLNLGHTIAHGIEKLSNYKISHGKAVAMGIYIILKTSEKNGLLSKEIRENIELTIQKLLPKVDMESAIYSLSDILECALFDKKRTGDNLDLVMIKDVGKITIERIKIDSLMEYFL